MDEWGDEQDYEEEGQEEEGYEGEADAELAQEGPCPHPPEEVRTEGGKRICTRCGLLLHEDDVTFDIAFEATGSSSKPHGSWLGHTGRRARSAIQDGFLSESRQVTLENARAEVQMIAESLFLSSSDVDAAVDVFSLVLDKGTSSMGGDRRLLKAACLYIVCRTRCTPHVLMDFAVYLRTRVGKLAHVYFTLVKALGITIPTIDPSLYIHRFTTKLNFGDKSNAISQTALKLTTRMKRDWIQEGRRPSGVVAAAILVAAKIHGCERSIEDVTKMVRMHEGTVRKRLKELQFAASGRLTVQELREVDSLGRMREEDEKKQAEAAERGETDGKLEIDEPMPPVAYKHIESAKLREMVALYGGLEKRPSVPGVNFEGAAEETVEEYEAHLKELRRRERSKRRLKKGARPGQEEDAPLDTDSDDSLTDDPSEGEEEKEEGPKDLEVDNEHEDVPDLLAPDGPPLEFSLEVPLEVDEVAEEEAEEEEEEGPAGVAPEGPTDVETEVKEPSGLQETKAEEEVWGPEKEQRKEESTLDGFGSGIPRLDDDEDQISSPPDAERKIWEEEAQDGTVKEEEVPKGEDEEDFNDGMEWGDDTVGGVNLEEAASEANALLSDKNVSALDSHFSIRFDPSEGAIPPLTGEGSVKGEEIEAVADGMDPDPDDWDPGTGPGRRRKRKEAKDLPPGIDIDFSDDGGSEVDWYIVTPEEAEIREQVFKATYAPSLALLDQREAKRKRKEEEARNRIGRPRKKRQRTDTRDVYDAASSTLRTLNERGTKHIDYAALKGLLDDSDGEAPPVKKEEEAPLWGAGAADQAEDQEEEYQEYDASKGPLYMDGEDDFS